MCAIVVVTATAWLAWGDQLSVAGAGDVRATGEAGRRPSSGLAIADFGGVEDDYGFVRRFSDAVALNFLSEAEISTYRDAGAGPARFALNNTVPQGQITVLVTQVKDRDSATAAVKDLNDWHVANGFARRGTLVLERLALGKPTARIHYQHNDLVVRVDLVGRSGQDVATGFEPLLARQLDVLPADG